MKDLEGTCWTGWCRRSLHKLTLTSDVRKPLCSTLPNIPIWALPTTFICSSLPRMLQCSPDHCIRLVFGPYCIAFHRRSDNKWTKAPLCCLLIAAQKIGGKQLQTPLISIKHSDLTLSELYYL